MIQNFTTRLVKKTKLADDIFLFRFALVTPLRINFSSGQYVLLQVPKTFAIHLLRQNPSFRLSPRDSGDRDVVRQYSICSPDYQNDHFDLLIEIVPGGLASNYLAHLAEGDMVEFRGPAGVFTIQKTEKNKIFLATGTGVAPIKSIIESVFHSKSNFDLGEQNIKFYLFWGLRYGRDVYFFEDFKRTIASSKNFSFRICLSQEAEIGNLDAKCFGSGRIDKNFIQLLETVTNTLPLEDSQHQSQPNLIELYNSFEYYICGAQAIVESLRQFVLSLGVRKENIYFEKFV